MASLQKTLPDPPGHRGLGAKAAAALYSAEQAAATDRAGTGGEAAAQRGSVFAPLEFSVEDGGVEKELAAELRRQEELNEVRALVKPWVPRVDFLWGFHWKK